MTRPADPPKRSALDRNSVLDFFSAEVRRPLSFKELGDALQLDRRSRVRLQVVLRQLVNDGAVVRIKGGRFGLPRKMNLVVGELRCSPKGYGFVVPERGRDGGPDVFVRLPNMGGALHGDRVVARIERRKADGRLEGAIIRVLDRKHARLLGRFERGASYGFVVPMERKILTDVIVSPESAVGVREGQIVEVEIREFPGLTREASGRIVDVVGWPDDPGIDLELTLRVHELPRAFPVEVRRAARALSQQIPPQEAARRVDFRGSTVVTIDGKNARDFDDAVGIEAMPDGGFRLGVHIADVASQVREGSALDAEALARATSVYFPDHVIPMLPEELSNGFCSLRPDEDRLTLSAIMELDSTGVVRRYRFVEGIIRSRARLTYDQVHAVLTGQAAAAVAVAPELEPALRTMWKLAEILARRRRERGSLDFDLPESEIVLDVAGSMTGIRRSERLLSHQLIEEFMILANEVVAEHFVKLNLPSLYRIHEAPAAPDVEELNRAIARFGLEVQTLSSKSFREILERVKGKPEERVVSSLALRTMRLAVYSDANTGHFGLASTAYTHFTSPIRRYPDLVVHRLLKEWIQQGPRPEDQREPLRQLLERTAVHCSQLERRAEEAEREYIERKKARFMADKVGERFWGTITAVEAFGFFVELEEFFVEGLVHLTSLEDDYYKHDEDAHSLLGQSTGRHFELGGRIEVEVSHVDLLRRKIDFKVCDRAERPRGAARPAPRPALRPRRREARRG